MEYFRKAKVFPQIQSSVVDFIFKCMTISSPVKSELAEEWTGRETLDISVCILYYKVKTAKDKSLLCC